MVLSNLKVLLLVFLLFGTRTHGLSVATGLLVVSLELDIGLHMDRPQDRRKGILGMCKVFAMS